MNIDAIPYQSFIRFCRIYDSVYQAESREWKFDAWENLMTQLDERVQPLRSVDKLAIIEYHLCVRMAVWYLEANPDKNRAIELAKRVLEETMVPTNSMWFMEFEEKEYIEIREHLTKCREELRAVLI